MVGQPHPMDSAALDAAREASMADEGGASAAVMEVEDPERLPPLFRDEAHDTTGTQPRWRTAFLIGIVAGVSLGLWASRPRR
jgi:hypothetical protein